jgi:hypothetical protein
LFCAALGAVVLGACSPDSQSVTNPVIEPDTLPALSSGLPARVTGDRVDEASGPQIHAVYVIASDGQDRRLDEGFPLHYSIQTGVNWLASRTGGLTFRLDTYRGMADISFLRLDETEAQLADADVRGIIHNALARNQQLNRDKLYIAYYDGAHNKACGGASWPTRLTGQVAAMHLRGLGGRCENPFVSSLNAAPQYWEMAAVHDLLHVMGIVSPDAPNHVAAHPGHVSEPTDLMYGGSAPWNFSVATVDISGDDYFGSTLGSGIVNLTQSRFLVQQPAGLTQNLSAMLMAGSPDVASNSTTLPPHGALP